MARTSSPHVGTPAGTRGGVVRGGEDEEELRSRALGEAQAAGAGRQGEVVGEGHSGGGLDVWDAPMQRVYRAAADEYPGCS